MLKKWIARSVVTLFVAVVISLMFVMLFETSGWLGVARFMGIAAVVSVVAFALTWARENI